MIGVAKRQAAIVGRGADLRLITRRWWFIAMELQIGMMTAAAFPLPGLAAPNT